MNVPITNCYICDCPTDHNPKNVFIQVSRYTGTPVCKILEKLVGNGDLSRRQCDRSILCHDCLAKIDEYDLAVVTADRVESELKQLFTDTINKYSSDDNLGACDDSEPEGVLKCEVGLRPDNIEVLQDQQLDDSIEYDELVDELIEQDSIEDDIEDDDVQPQDDKEDDDVTQENEYEVNEIIEDESKEKRKRGRPRKQNHSERNISDYYPATIVNKRQRRKCSSETTRKFIEVDPASLSCFCRKCGEEFPTKSELRVHIKTQHESVDKQVCDICGQTYKSKAALAIHVGLHQGRSPHECEMCGKHFTQKGALVRHMPIHTGERPYQCDKCGKQFIHYSSFHMHQLAHDNIREKKCSICGLELRSNSHLTRHMRVHSGEKPYSCPTCGQKFAQRYNMMTHFKAHQGIHRVSSKSHVCRICHMAFAKPGKLNEHLANQHNTCTSSLGTGTTTGGSVPSKQQSAQQTVSQTTTNRLSSLSETINQSGLNKVLDASGMTVVTPTSTSSVNIGTISNFLLQNDELLQIKKETFLECIKSD